MTRYQKALTDLRQHPRTWLITGVAGFIGSNLLETLLRADQIVVGLDNFSTGYQHNLDEVKSIVSPQQWARFSFIKKDIRDLEACHQACAGVDYVLHQAAIGSVPRSLEDPVNTNANNITGFLNMLTASRDASVSRFVYAASSSTYGDHSGLPKKEELIGNPLSPYAVTKYVNELYADVFNRCYGFASIGLRYFNIFGPRQDPEGAYAAVIPRWFDILKQGKPAHIYGDGETSRDFCYIDNAVQANILAASSTDPEAVDQVYNIAFGQRTTLNELFIMIKKLVIRVNPDSAGLMPVYADFRPGDVRHSLADIAKAHKLLGYQPAYSVTEGLEKAAEWYLKRFNTGP